MLLGSSTVYRQVFREKPTFDSSNKNTYCINNDEPVKEKERGRRGLVKPNIIQ